MSNFLHIIFVVLANIVCWGMLAAWIVWFISFFWVMITDKRNGRNPHNPNTGSGMPWG